MKKFIPFFFLVMLVISSCSQSFYNTRHHAHRDYVKLGPPQRNENVVDAKEGNSTAEIKFQRQTVPNKNFCLKSKESTTNFQPEKLSHRVKVTEKKSGKIVKPELIKRKKDKRDKLTNSKEVKASSVFNIMGFSFGLISIITFFICGIILLIGLLDIGVLVTGLALMWVCFVMSLLAILFGTLGVALQHPSKGLGIAGIVMGGIVFLSILMILLIMAVV